MLTRLDTFLGELDTQVSSPVIQPLLVKIDQGCLIVNVGLAKYNNDSFFLDHFNLSALVQSQASMENRSGKLQGRAHSCLVHFHKLVCVAS